MSYASEASKLPSVPAKISCTHQWRKWSLRTLAVTAFGYAFPKTTGRFRNALSSRFPTCTHEDSPFHPLSLRPQLFASSHFQGMVLVSVPGPGLSPDILYRCSCIRSGGETFLRPKGPSAVQPLSHITFIFNLYISLLYFFLII